MQTPRCGANMSQFLWTCYGDSEQGNAVARCGWMPHNKRRVDEWRSKGDGFAGVRVRSGIVLRRRALALEHLLLRFPSSLQLGFKRLQRWNIQSKFVQLLQHTHRVYLG